MPYQYTILNNAKELDQETGWYYYGARYYDPQVSTWLSVAPLVEKYPAFSPYNFTMNNPVRLVDADGTEGEDWYKDKKTGEVVWFNGSEERQGYEHLGYFAGNTDIDGNRSFYNGVNQSKTENGNLDSYFFELPEVNLSAQNTSNITNETNIKGVSIPLTIKSAVYSRKVLNWKSGYGDQITASYSAGNYISLNKNPITNTSTNFSFDKDNNLSYAGVSASIFNVGIGSGIDLKNTGLSSSVSVFGASLSQSLSLKKGFTTTMGFSRNNKYANMSVSFKPGMGALVIASYIVFKTNYVPLDSPVLSY